MKSMRVHKQRVGIDALQGQHGAHGACNSHGVGCYILFPLHHALLQYLDAYGNFVLFLKELIADYSKTEHNDLRTILEQIMIDSRTVSKTEHERLNNCLRSIENNLTQIWVQIQQEPKSNVLMIFILTTFLINYFRNLRRFQIIHFVIMNFIGTSEITNKFSSKV